MAYDIYLTDINMMDQNQKRTSFISQSFRMRYTSAVNDNKLPKYHRIKRAIITLTVFIFILMLLLKVAL